MTEPRLTTVMGVACAVLSTVGPRDGARVLVEEFGWDRAFQAQALLRGDDARAAFGEVWSRLVLDGASAALDGTGDHHRPGEGGAVIRDVRR